MIRFTTPVLALKVPVDLTGCDVWISLAQGHERLNIKAADVTCGETSVIRYPMSQSDTAGFKAGRPLTVQVNWISADGDRQATRQRQIVLNDNLLAKEVEYGD